MARTYKRDSRGRFAGGGGGSGGGRKGRSLPAPTKRTASGKTKRQGLLTQRAAVSAAQAKLKSKDPADRSLTGQLSLRAQKAAVTRAKNKLAAAQKTGRIRLSGRDGVIRKGKAKGGARKAAVAVATTKPKRRKTDQQIVAQVSRISERAWGRDRTLSQRTLSTLDRAAGGVEARASRRMARAAANENRAYEKYNSVPGYPGTRTKTNRLRAERQGSARRTYRDIRDRAQDVRGNVRINAQLTASVKQEQYARSAAGRSARRKQRAAENAASKAWVRGRR
jgi:hypothetical protein